MRKKTTAHGRKSKDYPVFPLFRFYAFSKLFSFVVTKERCPNPKPKSKVWLAWFGKEKIRNEWGRPKHVGLFPSVPLFPNAEAGEIIPATGPTLYSTVRLNSNCGYEL